MILSIPTTVREMLRISGFTGFLFILLFSSASLYSQGTVKGVVAGSDDNEPLLSAAVVVKGTTTGTITDYNGEYTLVLKAGTYTLQISYIGYGTREETVTVEDGQITELNVNLIITSIMGKEVVVTMQARGQLAAVNRQLQSNQIVNVVSSERIKELPDQNAAEAVSRLPGIHLDGSQIVIRGIQPKMNKILINGVEMPSTEAKNRATSIDMISANMLSGIEVYKTLTPDMDADAIGGVVNLTLGEAQEGLHYYVMTQGTYNQQEKYMGDFKVWVDASNRFFDNKFGASMSFNYDKYKGGDDQVSISYNSLTETEYIFSELRAVDQVNTSQSFGGSLILDLKLPKGKLILSNMFNHSTPDNLSYVDNINAVRYSRGINLNHSGSKTLLFNNSLRYEQQIGIVKLDASASYISIDREAEFKYNYSFNSSIGAFIPDSLSNARLLVMEPWEVYDAEVPDFWKDVRLHSFTWEPETYKEDQVIADLNLEAPLKITDQISVKLKAGGKYRGMERMYDKSSGRYGDDITPGPIQAPMADWLASVGFDDYENELTFPIFRDYNYQTNGGFLNNQGYYDLPYVLNVDYMDHMALDLMDYSTLQVQQMQWMEDYWGGERLLAGYLMAEANLWSRLIIIAGARYESLTNNYSAMEVANVSKNSYHIRDTINRPVTHSNLLPHLHARLKVTDWLNIRFSYNQTLSRPDYNYAVPSVYYDQVGGGSSAGNPNIAPALSKNLDANFTFYSRKLGLVTIGGFIKTIEGVFYPQPTLLTNIPDTTIINTIPTEQFPSLAQGTMDFYINNPNDAYLKGLELEWQSNLIYLPVPFNGLVFNINYTHVWSETDYPQHRVKSNFIPTFPYFELVENDTVYTNRLLHQANDIANVSLGYDYKGFSARASFRFQGNVISNVAERVENNTYTNDVYKFDFVMKQRIPLKTVALEVFFNAINFTNVPYSQYRFYPNKGETTILTRYSGRQFQLGIRLTK
jgi:TonB-dependent receptor